MLGPDASFAYRYVLYTAVLGLLPVPGRAEDPCFGGSVQLEVTTESTSQHFVGLAAGFGHPVSRHKKPPYVLAVASPSNACAAMNQTFREGTAVIVERGDCDFQTKAANLQAANVSLMILYNNQEGCVLMADNNTSGHQWSIEATSVSQEAGKNFTKLASQGAFVTAWKSRPQVFDLSALALWCMAVSTVLAGAYLAGRDTFDYPAHMKFAGHDQNDEHKQQPSGVVVLNSLSAVLFVAWSSFLLLAMYFFLNKVFFWILVGLYCVGCVQAMTLLLTTLLEPRCMWAATRGFVLPVLGPVSLLSIGCITASTAVSVAWLVVRNTSCAWILQDVMGISLILLLLRAFRVPNLKVATILLVMCFVYDVFWVFIQPHLTHGSSVMVDVATGGRSHEILPMLLLVPHTWGGAAYGVLGFGDVALPGLLVVFTRMYDLHARYNWRTGYCLPGVLGYGAGLVATCVALYFDLGGEEGQPALLYLVPLTLGTVAALAWSRGELGVMYHGRFAWSMDDEEDGEKQGRGEAVAIEVLGDEGVPVRETDARTSLLTSAEKREGDVV